MIKSNPLLVVAPRSRLLDLKSLRDEIFMAATGCLRYSEAPKERNRLGTVIIPSPNYVAPPELAI